MRFWPAGQGDADVRGDVPCSTERDHWTCDVPSADLDMSFKAPTYLARYRWGVVPREGLDLGTIDLAPGASLIGRITLRTSKRGITEKLSVRLRPRLPARTAARSSDAKAQQLGATTTVNRNGFFVFDGVPPGEYVIDAEAPGVTVEKQVVRIMAGTEAELRRPLIVDDPHTLDVFISPTLDAQQRRWSAQLQRRTDIVNVLVTERQETVSPDGAWHVTGLPAGDFVLTVSSAWGDAFAKREISLPGLSRVEIDARSTTLRGVVSLGGKPLPRARIWIGGESSVPSVRVRTNASGRYTAAVPEPFNNAIPAVTIQNDVPRVQTTLRDLRPTEADGEYRLDIELPDTAIIGQVVDESGQPVHPAAVNVSSGATAYQIPVLEDGSFDVHGIDAGEVRLRAVAEKGRQSDVVAVQVGKNFDEVKLVLRNTKALEGIVSSASGPVVGAVVHALPIPSGAYISPLTTTGADGRFQHRLPPDTQAIDMLVSAAGFARRFFRAPMVQELEVPLSQIGGTVVVDLPSPTEHGWPSVEHAGATRSLALLVTLFGGLDAGSPSQVRLSDLEPGQYTFCAPAGAALCQTVTLAPFGEAHVTLKR